jgi:6,7-dimethyl-8-ribityllumazine synthase
MPNASTRISFAHNARTVCIAFAAFAARYHQGNITNQDLETVFSAARSDSAADSLYEVFRDLGAMQTLLPASFVANKDKYDAALYKLFNAIINAGITSYSIACNYDSTLTATNFLKKDKNYYDILGMHWMTLKTETQNAFE